MQKINIVFQTFFRLVLIFFICFIWIRYFISSLWISVLITGLLTIIIDIIIKIFSAKKQSSIVLKKTEREKAENMFFSLAMENNGLNFFFTLTSTRHNSKKYNDFILISHPESTIILYPKICYSTISTEDIVSIVNSTRHLNPTKIVIPCYSFSKEASSFAKNFEIEIILLDQYDTYQKLYKCYNFYPEITFSYKKDKRLAIKDLAMFSLNKTRAKGYFVTAVILIFSSFFVRANLYYCIVASILVILALISMFDPFSKYNKNNELL